MREVVAELGIWAGATVGLLTVIDWLLLERQKKWLGKRAEDAWLWLTYQRLGRFIDLMRNRGAQAGFAATTHIILLFIISAYLLEIYFGFKVNSRYYTSFELGHPRLYEFQLWVDIGALAISAVIISLRVHPAIAGWIAKAPSIPRYLGRAWGALALCYVAAGIILIVQLPIIGFGPDFDVESRAQAVAWYENRLHGKKGVIIMHAATALISAPILAEAMLIMTIAFLSIYWIAFIWILSGLAATSKFILIRIIESPKGPVLGVSGFLVGIGAVIKAILG